MDAEERTERYVVVASEVVANRANTRSNVEEAVRIMPTAVEVGRIANWDSNVQLEPPDAAPASAPQVNLPVLAL